MISDIRRFSSTIDLVGAKDAGLFLLGIVGLTIGYGFYVLLRDCGDCWGAVILDPYPPYELRGVLLSLTDMLPSFLHVFAFSCLTYGAVGTTGMLIRTPIAWTALNVASEVTQSDTVGNLMNDIGYPWQFNGTFSTLDLIAAMLGGAVAFLIALNLQRSIK
ncbi:hypothetical protein [Cognatiyoonia sp. IB215182]|uniref:hypothetical protein n=1 Tax=Cognatiyoonia sp. IB215182 TaxID=3097353 RepID=UPI002A0CC03A|nr:hypothetical protein [Cognatiyoonia sp. IB215182]MDX8355801.1 hypothetical protein [Cognatiyoonia sp. IB215182]